MAISAYRIMPSMSRLNGAVMQMRGQLYCPRPWKEDVQINP